MPEQIIEKIKKNILPQWKVCFISALIVGIIAHLYKITNWLPNWDSLVFRYDPQNMLAMGRWFLCVVCMPSSFYDLPVVAGLLAILFHGLGAVCICSIFRVKKNITAVLIGAFIASFPTVTSVMMYNYVADGYALAFLFSCMATVMLCREKPCHIGAVILIALSVGIYQAYITVTIMLLLVYLIFIVLYENADFKKLIHTGVRFLLTGLLGMVLYYVIFNALLKITGTAVLEYQGMGSAMSFSGMNIMESLYNIKHSFLNYFFDFSKGISTFSVINVIICIITLILYIADIVKNKLSPIKFISLVLLTILLPIGANVLCFINSSIDYHNLMKMGYIAFYLFFILQYEKDGFKEIKMWTIFIVTVVLVFNYVVIANVSYHKLNMSYENSYGTLIRIADRIEQTEGADECDSILVLGQLPSSEAYSVILPPDMTGTTDGYILRADDEIVGQSVLCSALNDYCKKEYKYIYGDEKEDIIKKANTEEMGIWPDKNAISVLENVIIIKLSGGK